MSPRGNDGFPHLHACLRVPTAGTLFDVKFWPFGDPADDPFFALTGGTETLVCRPRADAEVPFELLIWFHEEVDSNALPVALNSLTWAQDPVTGKPWLCLGGVGHKHVTILDLESKAVARTLPGHGSPINDLAVSPVVHHLLASASDDSTIRLWNLGPQFEAQPCIALLAGEGHRAPVLAITFHSNGKWLLSGGIDTAVCLWAVPEVREWDESNDSSRSTEPLIVYYPHFFTKELHPNFVDCVAFYGDLILSKAARDQNDSKHLNEILLWKIEGFDADQPSYDQPPPPEPGVQTRSAFPHAAGYRGFHRLLTMHIPHTDRFFHRFGFFHAKGKRPILCMGDQNTRYSFWDMQRFEEGIDPLDRPPLKPSKKKSKRKQKDPDVLGQLRQTESVASGATGQTPDAESTVASSTTAAENREYTLSDRFMPLAPHYSVTANTNLPSVEGTLKNFATSQIAWSPDGTWMVTVGDIGMICMFHRDESVT